MRALPPKLTALLKYTGRLAEGTGCRAFAVGGFVRDILLDAGNYDVDITVEGDGIEFGGKLAEATGGALVTHRKFGTATVTLPWRLGDRGALKVDLATARRETYRAPAALPDVEPSSLRDDLKRRDFTINAMAIALERKSFGRIIDLFRGRAHLKKGIVSALHERSFVDDPTRILRAVRFEQRYGFRMAGATERLLKAAIQKGMLERTEDYRIRKELKLMLKEPDPARCAIRLSSLSGKAIPVLVSKVGAGGQRRAIRGLLGKACGRKEKRSG